MLNGYSGLSVWFIKYIIFRFVSQIEGGLFQLGLEILIGGREISWVFLSMIEKLNYGLLRNSFNFNKIFKK